MDMNRRPLNVGRTIAGARRHSIIMRRTHGVARTHSCHGAVSNAGGVVARAIAYNGLVIVVPTIAGTIAYNGLVIVVPIIAGTICHTGVTVIGRTVAIIA